MQHSSTISGTVSAKTLGSLFDQDFLASASAQRHTDAARFRRLARLRQAVDLAEDPTDIFEATTELLEAIVGDTASLTAASSEPTAGTTSGTNSPVTLLCDDAEYPHYYQQHQQPVPDPLLALKLCAALSEPSLSQASKPAANRPPAAAAAQDAVALLQQRRASCPLGGSPVTSTNHSFTVPAPRPAQLQCASLLEAMDTDGDVCADNLLGVPGGWSSLHHSFSTTQLQGAQGGCQQQQHRNHRAVRATHSASQLMGLQQQSNKRKQLQQQAQEKAGLYQLLCEQLQTEQLLQQQLDNLPARSLPQQQQLLATDQHKAALLGRLQRAIAVCAARNNLNL